MCATCSAAFLNPVLHIPLVCNAGQALQLGVGVGVRVEMGKKQVTNPSLLSQLQRRAHRGYAARKDRRALPADRIWGTDVLWENGERGHVVLGSHNWIHAGAN